MKGLVQQIQNYRISMTQGDDRVSERRPSEVPVLIKQQKPEATTKFSFFFFFLCCGRGEIERVEDICKGKWRCMELGFTM
jgi:hypothetical protein